MLGGGQSAQLTLGVTVASEAVAGTVISNTVSASSDQPDTDLSNNTTTITTTVDVLEVGLEVSKAEDVDPVVAGDQLTYTVSVTNKASTTATGVELAEALPGQVSLDSAVPSQGSYNTTTAQWSVGALGPGQSAQLTLGVTVAPATAPGTVLSNTVSASSDQADSDPSNNTTTATTTVEVIEVDLEVAKTEDVDPVVAGDQLTYTVSVTNKASTTATGVELAESLPGQASLDSAVPSQGSYNTTTGQWSVGALGPGQSAQLTLGVTVAPATAAGTVLSNTVSASSDQADSDPSNNTTTAATTVEVIEVDLEVGKTEDVDPVVAGDQLTYTVSVTNKASTTATGVELAEALPGQVSLESAVPSQGSYNTTTGQWSVGALGPGQSAQLTIGSTVAPATAPGTLLFNTVTASSDQPDSDPSNNATTITTTVAVLEVDLEVGKTEDVDPVVAGDQLTYTVSVANKASTTATGVELAEALPGQVSLESAVPSQGSYNTTTGQWSVGALGPGQSAQLTIGVTVASETVAGTVLSNMVTASSDQPDSDLSNNTATITSTVDVLEVDLEVSKTGDVDPVVAGDQLTYTVSITNKASTTATGVELAEALPGQVSLDSAVPTQGTYNTTTGQWSVGVLGPGQSAQLTLGVTVGSETVAGTALSNTVTASSDQPDSDPSDNTTTITTTVAVLEVDLEVSKTGDVDPVVAGDQLTYTVSVTNKASTTATNVEVAEALPIGVSVDTAVPSQGTYDTSTERWSVGVLGPGQSAQLTLAVTVPSTAAAGSTLTNTVTATGEQADPIVTNNTKSAITTVEVVEVDLEIGKTEDLDPVVAGDQLTYTVSITNKASTTATGVEVAESLPGEVSLDAAVPSQGSYNTTTGQWSVGVLAPGQSAQLTLGVTVVSTTADGTVLANTASASSDQADSDLSNNTTTATTTVEVLEVDLEVGKTEDPDPVVAGDQLTYTVSVTNKASTTATGVEVAESLPGEVSLDTTVPSQGSYNTTTGQWNVGVLGPGQSAQLTLGVTVVSTTPDGTVLSNTVSASSDQGDADPSNNTTTITTTVQVLQVDLEVEKAEDVDPVLVGGQLTYTVSVTNKASTTATGVEVAESLPSQASFDTAVPSQGSYDSAVGVWQVGVLAPGQSAQLTLGVTIISTTPDGTVLANTVSASSDQGDSDLSNNTTTATTTVEVLEVDLEVGKSEDLDPVAAGDQLTYTVTVANKASSTATGVEVTEALPPQVSLDTVIPSQGSYNTTTGRWSVGALGPGQTAQLTLGVTVVSTTPDGTVLANTVSASSDQVDSDLSNNSTTATTTVAVPEVDLQVVKTEDLDPVVAGDQLTYTVTVTNMASAPATGVEVAEAMPPDVSVDSAVPSQGGYNVATGLWSVGALGPGESAQLILGVTVVSTTPDGTMLENTVSASSEQADSDPSDNTATITTTVEVLKVDLEVAKTEDVDPVVAGDQLTYSVIVTNKALTTATGGQVTEALPAGVSVDTAVSSHGSYNTETGLWSVGALSPGQSAQLTLGVSVSETTTDGTVLENTVSVTSDQVELDASDNTATITTTVEVVEVDLRLTKQASRVVTTPGARFAYTIVVINNSLQTATGVTVTDLLSPELNLVAPTATQGSYNSATGTWNVGTLSAGQTESLILDVTVDPSASGTITNTAAVSSDKADPQPEDNTDSADTLVLPTEFVPGMTHWGLLVLFALLIVASARRIGRIPAIRGRSGATP